MGSWGTGIFQNDVSEDTRNQYLLYLKEGKADEECLEAIKKWGSDFVFSEDDEIDFWFALALIMHQYGRLTDDVKEKMLNLKSKDLLRWTDKDLTNRKKVVEHLVDTVNSPNPQRINVSSVKKVKLNKNDLYFFRLNDFYFRKTYFKDYYVVILVEDFVNYILFDPKKKYPLVYLKVMERLPDNFTDMDRVDFFKLAEDEKSAFVIDDDGMSDFFNERVVYWGNYQFKRPDNVDCGSTRIKGSTMKNLVNDSIAWTLIHEPEKYDVMRR